MAAEYLVDATTYQAATDNCDAEHSSLGDEGAQHDHPLSAPCPPAEKVYRQACEQGAVTPAVAARAACLIRKGLLIPDEDGRAYLPGHARAVLRTSLLPIEVMSSRLAAYAQSMAAAYEPYLREADTLDSGTVIERIEGPEVIHVHVQRALAETQDEVLTMQPEALRSKKTVHEAWRRTVPHMERGVTFRAICADPVRYNFHMAGLSRRVLSRQLQLRTLPEVLDRMFIMDRHTALISAAADRNSALLIRSSPLIDFLQKVFNHAWRQGTPFGEELDYAAVGNQISAKETHIARLLAEGCVDAQIAHITGLSMRTVREHIASLRQKLGSETRAQLGVHLVRSGIIDQAPGGGRLPASDAS